ncbi:MAG: hypothetical protein AAFU67_01095 [Bacteroidota bacterium]
MSDHFKVLTGTMENGKTTVNINGGNGNITLGGEGSQGDLALLNADGEQTTHIDGGNGNLTMGGWGSQGDITLLHTGGEQTVHIDGGNGNITLGGSGSQGDVVLLHTEGEQTVHIDGGNGNIVLGGNGAQGDAAFLKADGKQTVHIDGGSGDITLNGEKLKPADYVFRAGYPLRSLRATKEYIAMNGHLPGIPSEQEFKENGLSLAKFSMQLLEKVEEMTLHLIRQEEEIRRLRDKVDANG